MISCSVIEPLLVYHSLYLLISILLCNIFFTHGRIEREREREREEGGGSREPDPNIKLLNVCLEILVRTPSRSN